MQEPPNPPMLPCTTSNPRPVDLAEIMDAEGIGKVLVNGHDWGSPLAR
jgi:pimeloyl-ACP methyl ester carboxylesterase